MKNWLSGPATLLFLIAMALAQGSSSHADTLPARDRFVGAWRLAALEEPDSNGILHQADCTGLLVYTRDGHMSVQVMYRNAQMGGQAGPVQYAQGGYEASFGRYEIKDAHTFIFHVEGAMVRNLIGKDLPRAYQFSTDQLIITSANPNEHWRVTWQRY